MENKIKHHIHPELFTYFSDPEKWESKFLRPELTEGKWDLYCLEELDDIYTIPCFTEEFCDYIIDEAESCNCWTIDRHENYPTTDMTLSVLGLQSTYDAILKKYIWPLATYKYQLEEPQWLDMYSENFIARYHPYAQYHLALHHDMSQITVVVTLNTEDFTGGGTYFSNQKTQLKGEKGNISIHPGQITHRHGGLPVLTGQRYIVVSFCQLKR
tara:strand:+ start:205 stop:843 length:639 start_codon:yes stop_codon:yes gene_type:complete